MDEKTRRALNLAGAASIAFADQLLAPLGERARAMYYDRQGQPMGLGDWAARFHDWEYRVVERDRIHGALVSTVWMGIDHSFGFGPPLIFETMAADETGNDRPGWWDEFSRRYSSEEEARVGHAEVLGQVRALFAQDTSHHPEDSNNPDR
jgi:hypothetical protein